MTTSGNISAEQLERLVLEAQKGNRDAFGQIYDLLVDQVYRFIFFKVKNRELAQDIVSETFYQLLSKIKNYKKGNIKAYIFTIARNIYVDWVRKQKRTINVEDIDKFSENQTVEGNDLFFDFVSVKKALAKLPSTYQDIVILRFINGLSIKETARVVRKSQISVRVSQHRAIGKLRKELNIYE